MHGAMAENCGALIVAEQVSLEAESDLKSLIDHWVKVLDDWVQKFDEGRGGPAEGASQAMPREVSPDATGEAASP